MVKQIASAKIVLFLLFSVSIFELKGQDKVEASVGADLVSSYIWRGQDLGNVSVQPSVGISYKGLSLSAWGTVGFDKEDTKEIDITLGYSYNGFTVGVTDYWTGGHTFEANVGYDFGPVAFNWFTNFAGYVGYDDDGNKAYASYLSVSAPFSFGGIDWEAEVGATPWANDCYNDGGRGFQVSSVSLMASKEIKITKSYSLPLYGQLIWNPYKEDAWFVAGISF